MKIWCAFVPLASLFITTLISPGTATRIMNPCVDSTSSDYRCNGGEIAFDDCSSLTDADMGDMRSCFVAANENGVTEIDVFGHALTTLPDGFFAGLTSLSVLNLGDNDLGTLPAGAFEGMASLDTLNLGGNDLAALPDGVFEGMASLDSLNLVDNDLAALPDGVFEGMASLDSLNLGGNDLVALPAGAFEGLASLDSLNLGDNDLAELPAGVFDGLTALDTLNLGGNDLAALPAGAFEGMASLDTLNLDGNDLTELPADIFQGLTSLDSLSLTGNELKTLPGGVFGDLESLVSLSLDDNSLMFLPGDAFEGLTSLTTLDLKGNMLTTLPNGIFSPLTALTTLTLTEEVADDRANSFQCLPTLPSSPAISFETPKGMCGCTLGQMGADDAVQLLCGADMTCQSGTTGYTCASDPGGNGDPHMVGFSGQKFDFTGKNGSWYAVLKDGPVHINMRVSAPLQEVKEITYITGISIITADFDGHTHTMSIFVEHPDALDSSCPVDVSPCLANGALTILLDGVNVVSPGEVNLGRGVSFGAVNLPGACRPFGFEHYWARKVQEVEEATAGNGRRLEEKVAISMAEWILSDRLATNKPECAFYVAEAADGLFAHQSEHVSFQLNTPTFTMRLNYGKLHQLAVRDPTDQFDLPDHLTHQMNLGLSRVALGNSPEGILGETAAVRTDMHGVPIMTGIAVISGGEEDYKVEGALATTFKQIFP